MSAEFLSFLGNQITAVAILLVRLADIPLDRINSYRGALENGADFLGPVIGVGLISLLGMLPAFAINAASFFLCAAIIALTIPARRPRQPRHHTKHGLLQGMRFVAAQPHLRALALVGMVANMVLLPFLGLLLPVLTTQQFASPLLLGLCLSVFGLTATIGASMFRWLVQVASRLALYYGGLLLTAGMLVLCTIVESRAGVVGVVAVWAAAGCKQSARTNRITGGGRTAYRRPGLHRAYSYALCRGRSASCLQAQRSSVSVLMRCWR